MPQFPHELTLGYQQFRADPYQKYSDLYQSLTQHGQAPKTMVIACCDSRVAPETIFQAKPGELFVVRNIANLVPPLHDDTMCRGLVAALDFALEGLKIENIVVMGHSGCGGIKAALENSGPPSIKHWVSPVGANLKQHTTHQQKNLEQQSIIASLDRLRTYPAVAARRDMLHLYGAWFDISHGACWVLSSKTGLFHQI